MNRPALRRKFKTLTSEVADAFLRDLVGKAYRISEIPKTFAYPRDPDDEPYINLAAAADANYLVPWDNDLLDLMDSTNAIGSEFLRRFPRLRIVTPVEFLREMSDLSGGVGDPP